MSSNISRLQTPLPEGARSVAKAIMLRRINEGRSALGEKRLGSLGPECRPTSCVGCVLAVHLPIDAAWMNEVEFHTHAGYDSAVRAARALAEAWGTEADVGEPGVSSVSVALPPDLRLATQAFDAGQIPELIDADLGYVDPADLCEPVSPVLIEDHPAYYIGATVRLARPVERFPHFRVPAGATGVVVAADAERVSVRMDEEIPGAEEWDNEIEWYLANGDNPAEDLEGYRRSAA